ncbi:MAG: hypothetical protein FJ396_08250 [Verrucomicrobia bacterium]|nr:hypothetical protein [Verrucomicrobiota bacterium]
MNDTYAATILISGIQFVPMSGNVQSTPCTEADLALQPPPKSQPPGIFTMNGEVILVSVPEGFSGQVVLNFTLPDARYTLLGLAFLPSADGVGVDEFPAVSLSRNEGASNLAVTDDYLKADDDILFDFLILVQDVSSGDIGAIDPMIRSRIN